MCFSATSSFSVAAILTGVGAITTHYSKGKPSFAHSMIPLLFAVQQFCEGIVWLTIADPNYQSIHFIAAYVFVIFAFMLWPVWIPLSLWLMEKNPLRKNILFGLSGLGMLLALGSFALMLVYPLHVTVESHHIKYSSDINYPYLAQIHLFLYALATVLPFFVVRSNTIKTLGLLLFVTLGASYFYSFQTFISMWCYFAAITSAMVMLIIWE